MPFSVRLQLTLSEKLAVILTAFPSAVKPVNVSVCGLPVIAKVFPLMTKLPEAGASV